MVARSWPPSPLPSNVPTRFSLSQPSMGLALALRRAVDLRRQACVVRLRLDRVSGRNEHDLKALTDGEGGDRRADYEVGARFMTGDAQANQERRCVAVSGARSIEGACRAPRRPGHAANELGSGISRDGGRAGNWHGPDCSRAVLRFVSSEHVLSLSVQTRCPVVAAKRGSRSLRERSTPRPASALFGSCATLPPRHPFDREPCCASRSRENRSQRERSREDKQRPPQRNRASRPSWVRYRWAGPLCHHQRVGGAVRAHLLLNASPELLVERRPDAHATGTSNILRPTYPLNKAAVELSP